MSRPYNNFKRVLFISQFGGEMITQFNGFLQVLLPQYFLKFLHEQVGVLQGEHDWWTNFEHIGESSSGTYQHTFLGKTVDYFAGEVLNRLVCLPVLDKFDTEREAFASYVANALILLLELLQPLAEIFSDSFGIFLQLLLLHDVKHSESDGTRYGVTTKCVEVLSGVGKILDDLLRSDANS